jgi:hypothetical protein
MSKARSALTFPTTVTDRSEYTAKSAQAGIKSQVDKVDRPLRPEEEADKHTAAADNENGGLKAERGTGLRDAVRA